MAQAIFTVNGMKCDGCSSRLKKVLAKSKGILKASVSLEEKTAYVDYDDTTTNPTYISCAIEDAGFTVG